MNNCLLVCSLGQLMMFVMCRWRDLWPAARQYHPANPAVWSCNQCASVQTVSIVTIKIPQIWIKTRKKNYEKSQRKTFNKPNVNIQPGEENSKIETQPGLARSIFQIRMGRDYSKYYIYDTTIHTYMPSIQSSLKKTIPLLC